MTNFFPVAVKKMAILYFTNYQRRILKKVIETLFQLQRSIFGEVLFLQLPCIPILYVAILIMDSY